MKFPILHSCMELPVMVCLMMGKKHFGHITVPLQRVHIELTNVCEFNCVFCPKEQMTRPYGSMKTDLAKEIITDIGKNGIAEKITFHVMGEPTLHRDFFKILEHASQEGVPVGLTTNGAGLGGKTGKQLLDHNLHQIDISLQTPDEKSYALRKAGSLSYDNYISGIFDFFSAYQSKGRETTIKFRFLNTRFRKKRMEDRIGPVNVIPSTEALRRTFSSWAGKIHDIMKADRELRDTVMGRINGLVSYKWNVIEVYPHVFFETYVLDDWGAAFDNEKIHDAWAGYCFGMRDHFSILYNGDVVLCCKDFNGNTAIGNLHNSSLKEILSSDALGKILDGFRNFRVVHPYCKRCLGSTSTSSWLVKPVASVLAMKTLKPFFYKQQFLTNKD